MIYFLNFGTPFISLERLTLETSKIGHWGVLTKNAKSGQKWSLWGHVTYF